MTGAYLKYRTVAAILSGLLLTCMLFTPQADAQSGRTEEIIVKLDIPRLLQKDIFAHYDGENIYAPLLELFSLLEISAKADMEKKRFTGKYLYQNNDFEIDIPKYKARCSGRELIFDSTWYVLTDTDLFLRLDIYESLFDIKVFFNFSDLSIYIPLKEDFPIYQKLKRDKAHKKLLEARVASIDAHEIPRAREYLRAGTADWTIAATPVGQSGHYFGLNLGCMLMGGDVSLSGTGNTQTGVRGDQIRYRWHYYFNNLKYLTQAEVGEVNTDNYLARSLKGIKITNRPQARRKYFQTIVIEDNIGPGWEVELYVNNKLVDFAHTGSDGEYRFVVDIEYGSSRIDLKMYGPDGRILTDERFISVPFTLLPKGEYEYTLAVGESERYGKSNNYLQLNAFYGLLKFITLGMSTDYPLEKRDNEKPLTAAEMTFNLTGNFLLNGAHSPGNSSRLNLDFRKPSLIGLNLRYTKYYENEYLNRNNRLSNLSLTLSSPMRILSTYLGPRVRLSMDKYPDYTQQIMTYSFKLRIHKFHMSYIGSYKRADYPTRIETDQKSKVLLSTSILRLMRPQVGVNYNHETNEISRLGFYINKRIFRTGQLTFAFERNPEAKLDLFMVTFNIYTDFANFTSRVVKSANRTGYTQTQRGSVRFDQNSKSFRFLRNNGVGSGSAIIWPFHDENYNGTLDDNEELLPELRARIVGGARIHRRDDKLYYYDNLRPYDDYIVEIDRYSLDNPMLCPSHENFRVSVNPNMVTEINVPIVTAGEIAGSVDRQIPGATVGVGGIKITIINETTNKETELTTFNNGEFFYLGLVPGLYRAYIDPEQLERFGYISDPPYIKFQIKSISGGDYFGNAKFIIKGSSDKE
jgi:hypothetical protein